MDYFKPLLDFLGKGQTNFWIGVVEDNNDPMTLGRVKVRIFTIHPEDKSLVPTKDLPWAIALQPANSASTSGIGWSPNGLLPSSWVFGLFLDGELGQYPMVLGAIPGIHRGSSPGNPGGTGSGYLDAGNMGAYANNPPYHGQGVESPGQYTGNNLPNTVNGGNNIRDDGSRLTLGDKNSWPLKIYSWKPSRGDNGLACKGDSQLNMHRSTCMALEELTKQVGKGAFRINSAYRSPSYNRRVGGAKTSMHMYGRAFDIQKGSVGDIVRFLQLAVKNGFTGFGYYDSFIHIDTGTARAWGPDGSSRSAPSWFVAALRKAGWYAGKPGLQGTKTDPNNPSSTVNADGTVPSNPDKSPNTTSTSTATSSTGEVTTLNSGGSSASTSTGSSTPVLNNNTNTISGIATAYGPGTGGQEGGLQDAYGGYVKTLEDYRLGASSYVTIAANKAFAKNEYTLLSITYVNKKKEKWTLNNVKCIVLDTGSAFKTAPEGRFDIPVERYMSYSECSAQPFSGQTLTFVKGSTNAVSSAMPGFSDPTNSLPYDQYKGSPSTNENARGFNGNPQMDHTKKNVGSMSGFPAAGEKGTFGAPPSCFAPQYPHNMVYSSKTGHLLEFDDTPNAERLNLQHKSGTKWEISAKGSANMTVMGHHYMFSAMDAFWGIQGDYHMTSVGDMNIRTTSALTIQADGSKTEMIYGDNSTMISGKFDIIVGDACQIKANKIIIEANDIDIYAKGNLTMEAEGTVSMKGNGVFIESKAGLDMKAAGAAKLTGNGNVMLKGPTVYADDVIRMAEGGAGEAAAAKTAKSADLGKARPKKTIEKQLAPETHPDTYTTTADAADHYST